MKVLVVGTGRGLRGSGVTTMTDQLVSSLAAMGHDPVRLVAGDRPRRRPNRLNLENINAILDEVAGLARSTRRHQPDVVWLHTIGVPVLPAMRTLALVLGARLGCKHVVVHFHAFDLVERSGDGGQAQRMALRLTGRSARVLVGLHERDAAALRSITDPDKVVVLGNWVDVPEDPVDIDPLPPLRALYVGGLTRRKGLPELLQAMRLLEGLPITLRVVGGPGDEGLEAAAEYRASVADLVTGGTVSFAGELDAAGVRQELRSSHVFVLPSRAEATPRSLLEALAEGRPALVTDVGDMGHLVRSADCGVVLRHGAAQPVAEALAAFLADEARLVAQARNARRFAVTHLASETRHPEIEAVLHRAAL